MYGNNRNLPGGGKPTEERLREFDQAHAVGGCQLATHEAGQKAQAEKERKEAIPKVAREAWKRRKKGGVRPPGRIEVEVCRNAKGRFSRLLTPQELAARYGLMTGRDIPPPPRRRG